MDLLGCARPCLELSIELFQGLQLKNESRDRMNMVALQPIIKSSNNNKKVALVTVVIRLVGRIEIAVTDEHNKMSCNE